VSGRTRIPPRLAALVLPVCAGGFAAVAAAALALAGEPHSRTALLGVLVLFLASVLAQRFPVPIGDLDSSGVTLMFVFGVAAIGLFGAASAILVVFSATVLVGLVEHRPLVRIAYNASTFALAAGMGGALIAPIAEHGAGRLVTRITVCSVAYYLVNLLLTTAVVSVSSGRRLVASLRSNTRLTIIPFTLMGSAALILEVLWQRSPGLSVTLIGPLLAIALYQRSAFRALRAMRLALTDPLTGLGNHRHFHERLQRELLDAEELGHPVTLCLVDIDDFKQVNDRFGHPSGDRVLSQVAARLRQGGEAFRLGGDEFAVLLPGLDERAALTTATSIVDRIGAVGIDPVGSVTVSAGVATFPYQGVGRDELIRFADSALYWAKERGKNRVRAWRPDVVELAELKRLASGPDRAARYRAAASLAKAVDARDAYTGSHSERVAELSARIAERLGADAETVELTRLAASLHDLGKLAVPEEILRKPGELTETERLVLERHPQIGYRMLESLGVDPLAQWVLHHHERWDGTGYPEGLSETEIPLGARIILVADAYDAMTSDRPYRDRLTVEEAAAELFRCAGTQFDPDVVTAFAAELGLVYETAGAA
jgi:diguanylate cyclase (GGDEF)-like protein/putative nucleotidyltransferase with HDIG domain